MPFIGKVSALRVQRVESESSYSGAGPRLGKSLILLTSSSFTLKK